MVHSDEEVNQKISIILSELEELKQMACENQNHALANDARLTAREDGRLVDACYRAIEKLTECVKENAR